MPNITPGYDFGPTEVPRRDTLLLQATALQVTGIPLSSVDAAILKISINSATNATNLPSEGSLWVDAHGDLWGRTADGDVRVRRTVGGWETNRFKCFGDIGGNVYEAPGIPCHIVTATANSTNIDSARVARSRQAGDSGIQLQAFCSLTTSYSVASPNLRFTGRGPTRLFCQGFLPSTVAPRYRGYNNPSFASYWIAQDYETTFPNGLQLEADEKEPECPSAVSECRGYFMGLVVRKV